mmetsp:Transcript_18297/g.37033  ORF Transcript_18297/g.37033 Transcript_18297/m.37033 type:complete len:2677 (+) Transcript_18297:174-8204(+)
MSDGRTRRARTKVVDYSIEQQFSDDDIFEDNFDDEPSSSRKKSFRGRKSNANSSALQDEGFITLASSRPIYTEKGYDPSLPPLRERFTFEPEYEPDGTPKIELIVGRRPIEATKDRTQASRDEAIVPDGKESIHDDSSDEENSKPARRQTRNKKNRNIAGSKIDSERKEEDDNVAQSEMDYEYLLKYKGRSYLHLEWKTAADLESMNKHAKTIYRRFLKKLAAGTEEDLEDPTFDPAYTEPGRILAEEEHEIMVELTDKELLKWEKERAKEMNELDMEEGEDEDEEEEEETSEEKKETDAEKNIDIEKGAGNQTKDTDDDEEPLEIGEPNSLSIEDLRRICGREPPYYPSVPGSDNPYRDGYFTEPPKKPRPSYLIYQGIFRSIFGKRNPDASLSEIMQILGDTWRGMTEEEQAPYIQIAKEEADQYEKEKALLERAQRPSEMWQPLRRCNAVLDRLCSDPFASVFLEPVDTSVYNDYLEMIDHPMDLGTVRQNLRNKKYQTPEAFARDVRKIWNNCKIFNQHGSAIWHVADYMSKQFERIYHAWVLDFRDRYLRWVNPAARPWEPSCRQCDGKCKTPDNQMVLCDHCDAMYGISCLKPKLKKIPKGVWHCPSCAPKVGKNHTVSILSAVTEHAARKRAEIGDVPMKTVKQKMFLVKWQSLGYEHCTWETQEDINDDSIIAEFRRLEGVTPEEPNLTEKELQGTISLAKTNAQDSSKETPFHTKLYAQTRAYQFSKFGQDIPQLLGAECGPNTLISTALSDEEHGIDRHTVRLDECHHYKLEANEILHRLIDLVSPEKRDYSQSGYHASSLPPLLNGEYDTILPVTCDGLLMNVGEVNGAVSFLGYRQLKSGAKGPAEVNGLVHDIGDVIIAINGESVVGKTFAEVIQILKKCTTFAYMRFAKKSSFIKNGAATSCGSLGKFLVEDLAKVFKEDRRRLFAKRSLALLEEQKEDDESDASAVVSRDSDEDSDGSASEDAVPDSDDEDLVYEQGERRKQSRRSEDEIFDDEDSSGGEKSSSESAAAASKIVQSDETVCKTAGDKENNIEESKEPSLKSVLCRQETTRHLGLKLVDMDVGYSSDEGGDEDIAFFLDGVDATFTGSSEIPLLAPSKDSIKAENGKVATGEGKDNFDHSNVTFPAKKDEFATIGKKSQLQVAINLTTVAPCKDDFDNYPHPSTKELEEAKRKASKEARELEEREKLEAAALEASLKPKKKSTTKIEQISTLTSEIVHVWASAEDAASTLQIPLKDIRQILKGYYDSELGDEAGGFRWRFADEDAEVTEKVSSVRDSKKGKQAYLEFRDKLYDPRKPHIYKNGNKLRDYQVDGVNWLSSCFYKHHGSILADEMGLGKTVQIVTYLEHLFRVEKHHGPFLVVVPLSTVEHWRREFEGWTDMQCCVYHDRQRIWRDVLREYEWYYEDRPHTPDYLKFNVLVTTYDTLIGDFDVIGEVPWRVAVVDEAHRLRNIKGKLLECMKEISAKGTLKYGFQSRVLMTGTPLQNNTQELWTLLNFIEPALFRSLEDFEENFGNMANREQVDALQRKISPFMLRRVKEDVAKDIPAKEETVIDVELTSIQKQYYRAIFEHNHAFLSMGTVRGTAPKLMNIQMELRKCCNHPFLLDGVESREIEKRHEELRSNGDFGKKTPEEQHAILNEYGYVLSSGKMVLLDKLLPKLKQEGHKVLIFSQMVKMLDLISDYCDFRNFRHERLDGRVRGNERQKAIDRFETEEESFIFLLSTKAGGVGINLTAADICIIFDSDWNPQNDVQAQARCHRIGQTKDVMIYRLVTSRTFEQEMFDRASKKLGLEQAILGTFGQEDDDDKPTSKEMEMLLKKGAYALLEDENDEMGKEFVADDIENILAKRTRTRVVEGAKTASWLNKQGMNVTKSKFASESESAGIDIDDPMFWQKVMPDFVTPEILLNKISELETAFEKPVKGRPKSRKIDNEDDTEEHENRNKDSCHLSRGNQKKVKEFMVDLKGVMEELFEQDKDDSLQASDKATCQKLLLTISVKENIFNEEQRDTAKKLLQKLEGDRRRRCRTSEGETYRRRGGGSMGVEDLNFGPTIREELLIRSSKKKRKRRTPRKGKEEDVVDEIMPGSDKEEEEGPEEKKNKLESDQIDEDGFKRHSDDEEDWSDVDDDIYKDSKRKSISLKEAKRRREWGTGKDDVAFAALPWPVFPRHAVPEVLTTLIEEVIKIDKSKHGLFSSPVPREEFPEYYEIITNPMDYGTMKEKLERGEYRSAQAMQKDFVLVMQNCLQFNAKDSDIVQDCRQQTLMRPRLLRQAALENNLFICEDGSIIEVHDDGTDAKENGSKKEDKPKKKKALESPKKSKGMPSDTPTKPKRRNFSCGDCDGCRNKPCKQCGACKRKKRCIMRTCLKNMVSNNGSLEKVEDKLPEPEAPQPSDEPPTQTPKRGRGRPRKNQVDDVKKPEESTSKPRIRLKLSIPKASSGESHGVPEKKHNFKRTRTSRNSEDGSNGEVGNARKSNRRSLAKQPNAEPSEDEIDDSEEGETEEDEGIFDIECVENERKKLDASFEAAREHFIRWGTWRLPYQNELKFDEVAKIVLTKLSKLDTFSIFKEPVDESQAPGYYDVIKNPMDFGTMKTKVDNGDYGSGSTAMAKFYDDILLVFDNCRKFNEEGGEVLDEAAKVLIHVPSIFGKACEEVNRGGSKRKRRGK